MSARFEELAWRRTDMGELSLRRRIEPSLQVEVYEVKLGEDFLMSSLFTVAEVELARLALAEVPGEELDVVVGGLGLGFTARAALDDPRVRSLVVVEALGDVLDWHRDGLLPGAGALTADPRTRLVHGDFFALAADGRGLSPDPAGRRYDAVVVDIDHSPARVLSPGHAGFYTREGLEGLARVLRPGGVFALWSDDPPDGAFCATARSVFPRVRAHRVRFPNFYTGAESSNTVYVATAP